jgi:hypothetical protein
MAITNGYCTLSEVKSALRLSDSIDDTLIEKSIEGASRRIDGYCGRFFYKTDATAVPLFANNAYRLLTNDISSTTGLIVKLDNNGDGTFETTLTLNTDYIVEPTDYAILGRPIRTITMVGGYTFPIFYIPSECGVQITALWGFDAVPHDVREACVLLSIRQFARYNAALGVMAFADMAIAVRAVDPDVRDLLQPYKLLGVA